MAQDAATALREAAKQTMRRKQDADKLNNIPSTSSPSLSTSTPLVSSSSPAKVPSKKTMAKLLRDSAPTESETTLDYGDPTEKLGENMNPPSVGATTTRSLRASRRNASARANGHSEGTKTGAREEGEISDEESRARRQSKRTKATPAPTKKMRQNVADAQPINLDDDTPSVSLPDPSTQSTFAVAKPSKQRSQVQVQILPEILPNGSNGLLHPTLDTHSFVGLANEELYEPSVDRLSPTTARLNEEVFTRLLEVGVDDNNCRPGLPMTFEQFKMAKELILDLIGCGTTPEYLIDVGINRRLVVYCLRELKMRIPDNAMEDDIVPFGPPQPLATPIVVASPREMSPEVDTFTPQTSPREDDAMSMPRPTTEAQTEPSVISLSSTSRSVTPPVPPPITSLNIHAQPFVPKSVAPTKPPPKTTGPSLLKIALPHQQIGLPPRPEPSPVTTSLPDPPSSLPQRPSFSMNAEPSRKSSTEIPNSTTPTLSPAQDEPRVEIDTEATAALQRMEQEKKLQLMRKRLTMTRKRPGTDTLTLQTNDVIPKESTATESTPGPMIIGESKVKSLSPMDIDDPVSVDLSQSATTSTIDVIMAPSSSKSSSSLKQLEPSATLAQRRESLLNSTRSSTPSEAGTKRGIKRPKADDFLDKTPIKRPTLSNGVVSSKGPIRRSTYAMVNSVVPDQHVFTWSDDEDLMVDNEAESEQRRPESAVSQRESDAVQFAAAALAIGLPMTAEELETARIQEEERRAQLNAKAIKLLKTQLTLRRLELRQAEKKLKNVKQDDAEVLSVVEEQVMNLRQELQSLETRLLQHESSAVEFESSTSGHSKSVPSSGAVQLVGQAELSAIETMVKNDATSSTPPMVDIPSRLRAPCRVVLD